MPAYLRPCGPFSERAILTGDPARAMALAQLLTQGPRMANHARGLWGYHGTTPGGRGLNVQATGIGGPSGVAVLADLAELGVRRAVKVGTCVATAPRIAGGDLVVVGEAEGAAPHPGLTAALAPGARRVRAGAAPSLPGGSPPSGSDVSDLQTVALLEAAPVLGIELAVILVVSGRSGQAGDEAAQDSSLRTAALAAEAVL